MTADHPVRRRPHLGDDVAPQRAVDLLEPARRTRCRGDDVPDRLGGLAIAAREVSLVGVE